VYFFLSQLCAIFIGQQSSTTARSCAMNNRKGLTKHE